MMRKPSFADSNKTQVCPLRHPLSVSSDSDSDSDFVTSTQEYSPSRIGPIHSVPTFDSEDFDVGRFLGAGAFCGVFEASLSHLYMKKQDKTSKKNKSLNHSHVVAIKKIQGCGLCEHRINYALRDLVHERDVLSSLDHENIIRIYGSSPLSSVSNKTSYTFPFIVLEKLNCTLEKQLRLWDCDLRGISNTRREATMVKRNNLFRSRLQVASSIASALSYMHSNYIIFRDLKPSNVGFNINGDVKLFDLGLSVRVDGEDSTRLSLQECCGSPRYMAPEIFQQKEEYTYSVDVYSFGILLWEICSLKKPFGDCVSLQKVRKKILEGSRPKIPSDWNAPLQTVISSSWQSHPSCRPNMETVQKVLENEIVNFQVNSPSPPSPPRRLRSIMNTLKRSSYTL